MGRVNLGRVQGATWHAGAADNVAEVAAAVSHAMIHDFYLCIESGNCFRYMVDGGILKWVYVGCLRGASGQQGERGEQGIQGKQGERGEKGERGDAGPNGTQLAFCGEWATGKQYRCNEHIDLVSCNGSTYACKQTHVSATATAPPADCWLLVAAKGEGGGSGESGLTLLSTSTPVNATIQTGHTLYKTSSGTLAGKEALDLAGGEMKGQLVAQSNINYRLRQVRNTVISSDEPTGGSSGDIWIQYIP